MVGMDIVIVPTYFRPEFLYLSLEKIHEAEGSDTKLIWIYQDRKFGDIDQFANELAETETVIEYWGRAFGKRLRAFMRAENGYYGNSLNVLGAYAKAYQTDAKLVYLVEDDILITPDFFTWHESVQNSDAFCSVAGSCDRNTLTMLDDFLCSEYASLGVCWKRENLAAIIEHANQDYYRNQTPYILKHFPSSHLGLKMMEQDGLIQRIMEQRHEWAMYSVPPRAFHVGVFGYHRSIGPDNMFQGSLPERIEFYRRAVSDKDWLTKVAGFQSDVQAFPLAPVSQPLGQ